MLVSRQESTPSHARLVSMTFAPVASGTPSQLRVTEKLPRASPKPSAAKTFSVQCCAGGRADRIDDHPAGASPSRIVSPTLNMSHSSRSMLSTWGRSPSPTICGGTEIFLYLAYVESSTHGLVHKARWQSYSPEVVLLDLTAALKKPHGRCHSAIFQLLALFSHAELCPPSLFQPYTMADVSTGTTTPPETEKGSSHHDRPEPEADGVLANHGSSLAVDKETEKRLLKKLDRRIIPICCWIYLMNFMDRGEQTKLPLRRRAAAYIKQSVLAMRVCTGSSRTWACPETSSSSPFRFSSSRTVSSRRLPT